MSDPRPGHMYDPSDPSHNPDGYRKYKAKKKSMAKKMSPLGKLKSMLDDKPVTISDHLDWFKKHGTPKGKLKL